MKKYTRKNFIRYTALAGLGLGFTKYSYPQYSTGKASKKRIGIIGLDGSHAVAFTKVINSADASPEYKGYRVVAAYPQGSLDIESSVSRVPGYTDDMKELGIEIVSSIEELLAKVDVIFMVTNDGRRHLEQALIVFKAGKRMYIDKPLAASLVEGMNIFAAASHYNVPVYSSSNLRFSKIHQDVENSNIGKVIGADLYGPSPIEQSHPTLFWYGIHGVEALLTIMGSGCKSVVRVFNDDTDITVGTWSENRLGSFRAMRKGWIDWGGPLGTIYGEKGILILERKPGKEKNEVKPAYKKMIDFFETGIVPVTPDETLEVLAFMEAAEESKISGGKEVKLETVMQRALNASDGLDIK